MEVHPEFTLAFVEFDDQGRFWSRDQIDLLERTLDEEHRRSEGAGLTVILFAHGWRHNCDVCDLNVACFRTFLTQVFRDGTAGARISQGRVRARRIVAVYVGWRGLSTKIPPFESLSFWARKRVAYRIASGDLVELLTRVELFVRRANTGDPDRARFAVIGHSFGGTMIYSALANVLKMRVLEAMEGRKTPAPGDDIIRGFGDLVVLINPAFEASLFAPLNELASRFPGFSPRQQPVLIVIASETDGPNGMWFPLGRRVEALFERTGDRSPRSELVTAVGNFAPFWTHRLTAAGPQHLHQGADTFGAISGRCTCSLSLSSVGDEEARELIALVTGQISRPAPSPGSGPAAYGRATLTALKEIDPRNPFWVVRASDEVVKGHSGIFTTYLLDFIRSVIAEASARGRTRS